MIHDEGQLVSDLMIDNDICCMTNKRCSAGTISNPRLPSKKTVLLKLPDTKANYVQAQRYIFWNVVWKTLHHLGWVLDKDGNHESPFIALPPLDPICRTMKKNLDFFDDEVELMDALAVDPRLLVQTELRLLRDTYDEYLFQFKLLKNRLSEAPEGSLPSDLPSDILSTNKDMMRYLKSHVKLRQIERSQQLEVIQKERDEKESNLIINSILAKQQQQQQAEKLATTRGGFIGNNFQKEQLQKAILAELDRRRRKEEVLKEAQQQQQGVLSAKDLAARRQQQLPPSLKLPQNPLAQSQLPSSSETDLSGLSPSTQALARLTGGGAATAAATGMTRPKLPLPSLYDDMRMPMSSIIRRVSSETTSSNNSNNNMVNTNLKLSWTEIESAYHDLKASKRKDAAGIGMHNNSNSSNPTTSHLGIPSATALASASGDPSTRKRLLGMPDAMGSHTPGVTSDFLRKRLRLY